MWLTIYYWIICVVLVLLFGWNMFTLNDRKKQISCVICLIPLVLRVLYIH